MEFDNLLYLTITLLLSQLTYGTTHQVDQHSIGKLNQVEVYRKPTSFNLPKRQSKQYYPPINDFNQYNSFNMAPVNPSVVPPNYPYYQPYPYFPTTTPSTTARPATTRNPSEPIGYMLVDTYHSPFGYAHSRPVAYFTAS